MASVSSLASFQQHGSSDISVTCQKTVSNFSQSCCKILGPGNWLPVTRGGIPQQTAVEPISGVGTSAFCAPLPARALAARRGNCTHTHTSSMHCLWPCLLVVSVPILLSSVSYVDKPDILHGHISASLGQWVHLLQELPMIL